MEFSIAQLSSPCPGMCRTERMSFTLVWENSQNFHVNAFNIHLSFSTLRLK